MFHIVFLGTSTLALCIKRAHFNLMEFVKNMDEKILILQFLLKLHANILCVLLVLLLWEAIVFSSHRTLKTEKHLTTDVNLKQPSCNSAFKQ
jgi:hypothetical protein